MTSRASVMGETVERICHQCEMLESEAGGFCVDNDGRMANHKWDDPRDSEIENLHTELTRLRAEREQMKGVVKAARVVYAYLVEFGEDDNSEARALQDALAELDAAEDGAGKV